MFWADSSREAIRQRFRDKILTGDTLIIRDEKTLSGRVHVGSLRGIMIHGVVQEVIAERDLPIKFLFEINDFDPMDDCPPQHKETHEKYMGLPLCNVPSPDGIAKNFAEFFAAEFVDVIKRQGYEVEFYRASDAYREGKFNDTIRQALKGAGQIRQIYKEVSGSEKPDDWLPLNVICPVCGKIGTTKVISFDGEEVEFVCRNVDWAKGCGHQGSVSPFDGNGKLPWKVEWAAKWKVFNVDVEGAGKDHSTKGGSRDVSAEIARRIFDYENPFDIPYEFFNIAGKKMSSSKGRGASSKEISDLLPTKICRLLFLRKEPKKPIDFDHSGDTIPNLFDEYDRLADAFFSGDAKKEDFSRIFELIHTPAERPLLKEKFLPRFREIAFLSQLPHVDIFEKLTQMKGGELSEDEKSEARMRIRYAEKWLTECAPEQYIFKISDKLPEEAKKLNNMEKELLQKILVFFEIHKEPSGEEVHGFLHDTKREMSIEPREMFSPIYRVLLGKNSGPKAGWLLSVLGGEFVKKRISEALESAKNYVPEVVEEKIIPAKRLNNSHFFLSSEVAEKFPNIKIAYAIIEGVNIEKNSEKVEELKAKLLPSSEEAAKRKESLEIMQQYTQFYRDMGVDPTKKKPTTVAMFDRIADGKGLYNVNTFVDIMNILSLQDGISFGAYDADNINFPVQLKLSKGGESFLSIGERKEKTLKSGEVCVFDEKGLVLNRNFNYRDSQHTCITEGTKKIFLTFDIFDSMMDTEAKKRLLHATNLMTEICGGEVKEILVV